MSTAGALDFQDHNTKGELSKVVDALSGLIGGLPSDQQLTEESASLATDVLSVLHSHQCPMAKTWQTDDTVKSYSNAKYFRLKEAPVKSIHDLSALLARLEPNQNACIIRGKYIGDELAKEHTFEEYKPGKVLRRDVIFGDQSLHTVLIEVDDYRPLLSNPIRDPLSCIEEYILFRLPKEFQEVSYHWQLSNSAGHPTKKGKLKVHLWFWLAIPRTSFELKEWAKAIGLKADHSVFNKIQIHYTSAPIFEEGVADPIIVRSGFYKGKERDVVELDIELTILAAAKISSGEVHDPSNNTANQDEVAKWLREHWEVLGESADGAALHIRCPWESDHTTESDSSSTVYFLAGTGGYVQGHFNCKHSHCSERNDGDFLHATGYRAADFENLELPSKTEGIWDKPVDVSLLLRTHPTPIEWLIPDRIQMGRGILLTGVGGSSKTRAMYHLAIGAAIGRLPWNWEVNTTGKSLLVLTEDTKNDVHRTLYGLCQAMGLNEEERKTVAESVIPYALAGAECRLLSFNSKHVLEESRLFKELEKKIKSLGNVVFVGLDPALSLSPGDELDQSHQRILGKMADDLAVRTGATVMLVSHASKASLGREELDSHNSRGGGAITDAVRGEFSMRTMTAKEAQSFGIADLEERKHHVQLVATKGNHLSPAAYVPVWLMRGEYGALSTTDLELEIIKQSKLKVADIQIFDVLKELPMNTELDVWRTKCIHQKLIIASTPEAQKKSMQRSVDRLKQGGYITSPLRGVYIPSLHEEPIEEPA